MKVTKVTESEQPKRTFATDRSEITVDVSDGMLTVHGPVWVNACSVERRESKVVLKSATGSFVGNIYFADESDASEFVEYVTE